jgi:hypothetical protein
MAHALLWDDIMKRIMGMKSGKSQLFNVFKPIGSMICADKGQADITKMIRA